MLRSILISGPPQYLTQKQIKTCNYIASHVILQCILITIASVTIITCVWTPSLFDFDPYKLASIMYLYDKGICAASLMKETKQIMNLQLNIDTKGFNVTPIRWEPATVTVSERVSHKTRSYILTSMCIHVLWFILTIAFKIIVSANRNPRLLNYSIHIYFFLFVCTIIFDLSMAIVYITHIRKALTKGMIVRNSGWSIELKMQNYDEFAGYLPLLAAACWMRGILFLTINIYSCKRINDIRSKLKMKNVMMQKYHLSLEPFPNPIQEQKLNPKTLYYRAGERKPYVKM